VLLREILTDEGLLAWVPTYLRSVVAESRFAPYRTVPALAAGLLDQADGQQESI
jgi:TorA maturation chaperone TorD